MDTSETRLPRGLIPLVLVSAVVVLIAWGSTRGVVVSNVHNGLLALSFSFIGAYVLFQRPGHREGRLFMAAGVVEGVMFLGRQIGRFPTSDFSRWWGWLGVWPLVVSLALCTFAVICFPDGRLLSRGWRWVAAVVVALTVMLAVLSAVWPVEYASAGVVTPHPITAAAPGVVAVLWAAVAHPVYAGFQLLWVVAVTARWRSSTGLVRRQLAWVVAAAAFSAVTLTLGLLVGRTPLPGLLSTPLLPVAAGWSIVNGQHLAAYAALTWLSRSRREVADLPTDLAQAVAAALTAPSATVWMGSHANLHAVGVWPETPGDIPPVNLEFLRRSPVDQVRALVNNGAVVGALSAGRLKTDPLSLAEERLLDDLTAQAGLVIRHLGLSDIIARQRKAGHLDGLTPRERDVLELMALGRSNAAISQQLHLSVKTVEPIVGSIFAKLGLHADATSNRRVLAVLAFVRN